MSEVSIRNDGAIRRITLTRSDKRNAINGAMMASLLAAFQKQPEAGERVTILDAEGPVFCSGMDLVERVETLGEPSAIEDVFYAIETYPLPVIAVVQGPAIAGGCEMALHCDFVVAADSAVFGMSLAQIGLTPTWFLAKKLLEVGGPVFARRVLMLGDPVPTQRLYDTGVISHICPADKLVETAEAVADRLSRNAPKSLRAIKQILLREMTYRDALPKDDLAELVSEVGRSADAKEGIAARLGKREANFQDR
jgi:enoyl-CoA hydratase/carnithine racemase